MFFIFLEQSVKREQYNHTYNWYICECLRLLSSQYTDKLESVFDLLKKQENIIYEESTPSAQSIISDVKEAWKKG